MIYILLTKNVDEATMLEYLIKYDEEGAKAMLTFEDYFTKKGIEQGIEQGLEKGLLQGLEKGKNVGKDEAKLETAKKMIEDGISIEIIAKYTGLPVERIKLLFH